MSPVEKAYRAWIKAADRGYGNRNNTKEHMDKVDANIRRLKAKYEALAGYREPGK